MGTPDEGFGLSTITALYYLTNTVILSEKFPAAVKQAGKWRENHANPAK